MSKQDNRQGSKKKNKGSKSHNPILTALPEEIVSRKPDYKTCPKKAKLLMFLAALPISLVVGVIAHFVGICLGYVGLWFGGLPYFTWLFSLVAVMVTWLGYPFLVGMLNHGMVESLGKKGFGRNPKITRFAGLLNGIPLYLGHVLASFLISKQITTMALSPTLLGNWFLILDTTGVGEAAGAGGVVTVILCALEFIALLAGSYVGNPEKKKDDLFCEEHQTWYASWGHGTYPVSLAKKFEQRLASGVPLQPMEQVGYVTYPRLDLDYRICLADDNCDVQIKAELKWEGTASDKRGHTYPTIRKEVWFDAMFPGELGHAILSEMHLEPPDKIIKFRWF